MSIPNKSALISILIFVFVMLPACSINVKKNNNGEDKNVDINTPMGGIHVSNDADVRDTGLAVYPGARLKNKDKDGDEKNANVDISGFGFGIKVVAVEYESGDSQGKVIAFYQDQLKKYGKVLECRTSGHVDYSHSGDSHGSQDLHCDGDNSGDHIELKAGTENNQHIVAIEPNGNASRFTVVYVRTRGKDSSI